MSSLLHTLPLTTEYSSLAADLPYWSAFSFCRNLGSVRLRKIYTHFKTMNAAWRAPLNEFKVLHLEETVLAEIETKKKELDPDRIWKGIQNEGLTVIPYTDAQYPSLLKEIYDPPALLYVRGNLTSGEEEIRLAVVGTRKITPYGEQMTESLVYSLAENGVTIVSGLAYGVDALAHETTLKASGKTIAVLGCGLDRATIYPSHHVKLADLIAETGGCVISEHAPGTPPLKQHFPFRNRIIAGLSRATLVIEAPDGSGALTTAAYALEFNRDVFAVPGPATAPASFGPNELIKKGALLVTESSDIFNAFGLTSPRQTLDTRAVLPNTEEELKILDALSATDSVHIDALARSCNLPPSAAATALTLMEMKAMVKNVGGMRYIKLT